MSLWKVEVRAEAREVYYVDADSEADALANWHTGQHELTEVYGAEPASAEEVEGD